MTNDAELKVRQLIDKVLVLPFFTASTYFLDNNIHQYPGQMIEKVIPIALIVYTVFFKQPHFRVEPRVAIKIPKMTLKVV